ncbi:MAG: hypothetical protein RLZ62_14, partial [Bacteroidota bacterium]
RDNQKTITEVDFFHDTDDRRVG